MFLICYCKLITFKVPTPTRWWRGVGGDIVDYSVDAGNFGGYAGGYALQCPVWQLYKPGALEVFATYRPHPCGVFVSPRAVIMSTLFYVFFYKELFVYNINSIIMFFVKLDYILE